MADFRLTQKDQDCYVPRVEINHQSARGKDSYSTKQSQVKLSQFFSFLSFLCLCLSGIAYYKGTMSQTKMTTMKRGKLQICVVPNYLLTLRMFFFSSLRLLDLDKGFTFHCLDRRNCSKYSGISISRTLNFSKSSLTRTKNRFLCLSRKL